MDRSARGTQSLGVGDPKWTNGQPVRAHAPTHRSNSSTGSGGVRKEYGGVWARSLSTAWVVVVLPGAAMKRVVFPTIVRRVNQQTKATTWTLEAGEGFVAGCEPVFTPGRADCPGYFGAEAEVVPQPLNPWLFL